MLLFPNAKINIGLFITEKRPDGYHNIESVFYPAPVKDALEAVIDLTIPDGEIQFMTSGNEIPGDATNNLCLKVHREISKHYPLPGIKAQLHKLIPTGAGLGGGSADAAFFINLLNSLCQLNISQSRREEIAAQIGSDCSFFIQNKPAFCYGRGELSKPITLINLKHLFLVTIYPNIHISTQEAYTGVVPTKPEFDLQTLNELPLREWKGVVKNDFEDSLFPKYPKLAMLKDELYQSGAVYAAMSGSGSTVYGLFESKTVLVNSLQSENIIYNGLME